MERKVLNYNTGHRLRKMECDLSDLVALYHVSDNKYRKQISRDISVKTVAINELREAVGLKKIILKRT